MAEFINKFQKEIKTAIYLYFFALAMTITLSIAIKILNANDQKDEEAIQIFIRVLDILKYPLLNLVDIAFIDFGLKLMIVQAQVFTNRRQNTPTTILKRFQRAIIIQRTLLVAFAVFLVFFALQNIYNCFEKPRATWFRIASYSYIVQDLIKMMLYVLFWTTSFTFIERLHLSSPKKKKCLFTLFFIASLLKWLLFIGSLSYILYLLDTSTSIVYPRSHNWFVQLQWMTYAISDI